MDILAGFDRPLPVFVVGNDDDEDVTLRDGHRYIIRARGFTLRGTLDARASSPARLRFRGLYADEFFTVHPRDILDARPT